jgi:transposase
MRPRQKFTEEQKCAVRQALKSVTSKEDFQRVQAVLLRMELGLRACEIAEILGLHTASVWKIHARFFREGVAIFESKPHGGRYRENLSMTQERKMLKPFLKQAERSGMLIVSSVKAAYEKELGGKVSLSSVYRMLERHGWRKIVPRPSHPKADPQAREAFKKTLPH